MGDHGRSTAKATIIGAVEDHDDTAGELILHHAEQATSPAVDALTTEGIDTDNTVVKTDAWKADWTFDERNDVDQIMIKTSQRDEAAHALLPWIHVVWGNLKRVLRGVHTTASRAQLQDYLDLFSYRFNHRGQLLEGLETALEGLVQAGRVTREQLKGGAGALLY